MDDSETLEIAASSVKCDGGGGALGHPAVYLSLGETAVVDCPYCGQRFVRAQGATAQAH